MRTGSFPHLSLDQRQQAAESHRLEMSDYLERMCTNSATLNTKEEGHEEETISRTPWTDTEDSRALESYLLLEHTIANFLSCSFVNNSVHVT
jgi:hypothetical protein